jgi:hypothetical protein
MVALADQVKRVVTEGMDAPADLVFRASSTVGQGDRTAGLAAAAEMVEKGDRAEEVAPVAF